MGWSESLRLSIMDNGVGLHAQKREIKGVIYPPFQNRCPPMFFLKNRRNQNEQAGNIHFKYHADQGKTGGGYCHSHRSICKYRSLLYPQASAEGCNTELLPTLRKAGDTTSRQESKTVLFGSVPKCVVERSHREYQSKSILSFYLCLLRKGVYKLWK